MIEIDFCFVVLFCFVALLVKKKSPSLVKQK